MFLYSLKLFFNNFFHVVSSCVSGDVLVDVIDEVAFDLSQFISSTDAPSGN